MLSIGGDAGNKSGHVVAIDGAGYFDSISMTCTHRELGQWFHRHAHADICVVEHVEGRGGMSIKSQCGLVGSYQRILQAASVLRVVPETIRPQDWQAERSLIFGNKKGWSKHFYKEWKKNQHLECLLGLMDFWIEETGEEWVPDVEIADAILLAFRGLERLEGEQAVGDF